MTEKQSPFACDMTAIAPEQRGAHIATIEKLFGSVQSSRELPEGYAFELPNEPDVLRTAAEFIVNERLCCPFFGFALEIEREGGSVWLSLVGRDGVKPFIMAEIGEYLPAGTSNEAKFMSWRCGDTQCIGCRASSLDPQLKGGRRA